MSRPISRFGWSSNGHIMPTVNNSNQVIDHNQVLKESFPCQKAVVMTRYNTKKSEIGQ